MIKNCSTSRVKRGKKSNLFDRRSLAFNFYASQRRYFHSKGVQSMYDILSFYASLVVLWKICEMHMNTQNAPQDKESSFSLATKLHDTIDFDCKKKFCCKINMHTFIFIALQLRVRFNFLYSGGEKKAQKVSHVVL